MIIGVDFDDTLKEFTRSFLGYYNARFGTGFKFEDISDFTFWPLLGIESRETAIKIVGEFYKSEEAYLAESLPGAADVIGSLSERHKLCIVSARPDSSLPYIERWLSRVMPGRFSAIHLTNQWSQTGSNISKAELCSRFGVDVLIDDSHSYLKDCAIKGLQTYLIDRPWNRGKDLALTTKRVNSWYELAHLAEESI